MIKINERIMNKRGMYKYRGHENDGVDGFMCLSCFKHFSLRTADFKYCLHCGVEFTAEAIRHLFYTFELPCSDDMTEWKVESAIKWNEDDTEDDLNWTEKGYTTYATPKEALEAKQHHEMDVEEELQRYEKHSGKEKKSFFEIFRVARQKRNRKSWEFEYYKMSDIKYYKKMGKHITTCKHPLFVNKAYMD